MLPALAVIGVALAMIGAIRHWRDCRARWPWRAGWRWRDRAVLAYYAAPDWLAQSARDNLRELGEQLRAGIVLAAMLWLAVVALLRGRAAHSPVLRYGGGLRGRRLFALALFVPILYRYSTLHPDEFWNRTRGRMFG
jgi:hypothetical protein